MKFIGLKIALVLTLAAFTLPGIATADPALDQIKANVEKRWKPMRERQRHVTAQAFKQVQDEQKQFFELLDVRTQAEFEAGHLPGALNIERGLLEFAAPRRLKDPNVTIYVYCKGGKRGTLATQTLLDIGYKNAIHIYDGFKGWVSAGYPVYNTHGEFVLTAGGFEKEE